MQNLFFDKPSVLRPNQVDDDYCYFLAQDEACVYRYNGNMTEPEIIVRNANGFTVVDEGVLFFRPRNGNKELASSLYIYRDGQEYSVPCAKGSFAWANFLCVGDYLLYDTNRGIKISRINLEGDARLLDNSITLTVPNCYDLTDLLWIDGNSIWYLSNHSSWYGEICKYDISTGEVENSGISTLGYRDHRHDIYPAVQDGIYYYQVNGVDKYIHAIDLASGTIDIVKTIPENNKICAYGTTTGQCFMQVRSYLGSDPKSTTGLVDQRDVSFLRGDTARAVFGDIIIANEYDILDYDCYHRTVIYNEKGERLWTSDGSVYYKDY